MAKNLHFNFDLVVTRGDTRTIPLRFYKANGDPEDISTWLFFYTAKESLEDTDENAAITIDPDALVPVTNPDDTPDVNTVYIVLTSGLTDIAAQSYYQDIQIVNGSDVNTYAMGTLIIEDGVTKRKVALEVDP